MLEKIKQAISIIVEFILRIVFILFFFVYFLFRFVPEPKDPVWLCMKKKPKCCLHETEILEYEWKEKLESKDSSSIRQSNISSSSNQNETYWQNIIGTLRNSINRLRVRSRKTSADSASGLSDSKIKMKDESTVISDATPLPPVWAENFANMGKAWTKRVSKENEESTLIKGGNATQAEGQFRANSYFRPVKRRECVEIGRKYDGNEPSANTTDINLRPTPNKLTSVIDRPTERIAISVQTSQLEKKYISASLLEKNAILTPIPQFKSHSKWNSPSSSPIKPPEILDESYTESAYIMGPSVFAHSLPEADQMRSVISSRGTSTTPEQEHRSTIPVRQISRKWPPVSNVSVFENVNNKTMSKSWHHVMDHSDDDAHVASKSRFGSVVGQMERQPFDAEVVQHRRTVQVCVSETASESSKAILSIASAGRAIFQRRTDEMAGLDDRFYEDDMNDTAGDNNNGQNLTRDLNPTNQLLEAVNEAAKRKSREEYRCRMSSAPFEEMKVDKRISPSLGCYNTIPREWRPYKLNLH